MTNIVTKLVSITACLSFTLAALITSTNASAAEKEIILHDAIHDYTDEAYGSYRDTLPVARKNAYKVRFVLDEAQHDYASEDIAAFNEEEYGAEQAEFAAFEELGNIPWELTGID